MWLLFLSLLSNAGAFTEQSEESHSDKTISELRDLAFPFQTLLLGFKNLAFFKKKKFYIIKRGRWEIKRTFN